MALQKQHNGVVIFCFSRNMSSFKTYIQIINPFTTIVLFGLPCGSAGKESTCNVECLCQTGMQDPLKILMGTFESVLMRWMKLEPIIQSEVSQKEKHQYSILTHIYGI